MPKKGNNIRKRKDGRWEGRYIGGYGVDGKAKYKSIYGRTYSEVKIEKSKKENEVRENDLLAVAHNQAKNSTAIPTTSNITIDYAVKVFLEKSEHTMKESTFARYSFICEKHILPYFGAMKLNNLSNEILNDFIQYKIKHGGLKEKALSTKTINDITCLLVQIIKKYCNFDIDIKKPSHRQKDVTVFTNEEFEKIKTFLSIQTDTKKLGIIIVLFTGIRLGELCALKWEDIDLTNNTITINKTMQRIKVINSDFAYGNKTKIKIDEPKTNFSMRIIPISSILQEKLREFNSCSNSYVLTNTSKYIEPRVYQRIFKDYLKFCGVKDNKFHTLRHTFATMAILKGMDVKTLSILLGHSDIAFTMKRYVHPDLEHQKIQIEKLVIGF